MKKPLLLALCLLVPLLLGSALRVKADPLSPTVVITPPSIQRTGYVDIDVTPAKAPTTLNTPIEVGTPYDPPAPYNPPLAGRWRLWRQGSAGWQLVSITLPDMGDHVIIRFGAGGQVQVTPIEAGATNILISPGAGPYAWENAATNSPPNNPPPALLPQGTYGFAIGGTEGSTLAGYFCVTQFLVVPEVPFGVVATLMASLAGLGLRRLRRKY